MDLQQIPRFPKVALSAGQAAYEKSRPPSLGSKTQKPRVNEILNIL